MKKVLLLFLLITASLITKGQVVVTLNFPDPCSCDNSVLNELLNLQNVSLTEAADTCFNATQTIEVGEVGAPFVMQTGASAEMIAGQRIVFKPYTHIKAGSQLHAYIAPGGPFCGIQQSEYYVQNSKMAVTTGVEENSLKELLFKLYPNPTTGMLNIELTGADQSSTPLLDVFDLTGNKLKMLRMEQSHHTMNISGLPSGIYIISVTSGEFKKVKRVIKL